MTIVELRDWIDSNGIQMLFGDSKEKNWAGFFTYLYQTNRKIFSYNLARIMESELSYHSSYGMGAQVFKLETDPNVCAYRFRDFIHYGLCPESYGALWDLFAQAVAGYTSLGFKAMRALDLIQRDALLGMLRYGKYQLTVEPGHEWTPVNESVLNWLVMWCEFTDTGKTKNPLIFEECDRFRTLYDTKYQAEYKKDTGLSNPVSPEVMFGYESFRDAYDYLAGAITQEMDNRTFSRCRNIDTWMDAQTYNMAGVRKALDTFCNVIEDIRRSCKKSAVARTVSGKLAVLTPAQVMASIFGCDVVIKEGVC